MTNEEILRLAEQCGFYLIDFVDGDEVTEQIESQTSESLYIFASMLLVMESEKCAKLCDDLADLWNDDGHLGKSAGARICASDIRERNA